MAERKSSLNTFLSSLSTVKPNNIQTKEVELARVKNRIRKAQDKRRKQKQRMREMAASLQATEEEINRLQSEALCIQTEMSDLNVNDDMD